MIFCTVSDFHGYSAKRGLVVASWSADVTDATPFRLRKAGSFESRAWQGLATGDEVAVLGD